MQCLSRRLFAPYRGIGMCVCLCCLLMLGACTSKTVSESEQPADCPQVYTVAPGNYILELASGAEVILDPLVHDFPLFCSPEAARIAIHNAISQNILPDGDWRVYLLDGEFEDLAVQSNRGPMLRRMAALQDWVVEKK